MNIAPIGKTKSDIRIEKEKKNRMKLHAQSTDWLYSSQTECFFFFSTVVAAVILSKTQFKIHLPKYHSVSTLNVH